MTACNSLAVPVDDSDVILSNYSVSLGSTVQIGCRMFGRRLTSGVSPLICSNSGGSSVWKTLNRDSLPSERIFTCKWNGELNTYEKLIIGMGSAGVGLLIFGTILICCLAYIFRSKRDLDSDIDSYPPSQINEKVSYAQPYGDGHRGGGGSDGIRGYRASGKYEKQITDSRNDYPRSGPYSISDPRSGPYPDTGKRDPFLWSEYNAKNSRETPKPETGSGYQYYKGKPSQYDNRAFENDRGPGGYRETGHSGTNYLQGKREDYRWNSNTGIPRAHT